MSLLNKIFGDANDREVKRLSAIVELVNGCEDATKLLTPDALRAKTEELKKRLKDGAVLDDILPEAFALVREAARRTLGQRHFDAQLIGGLSLHEGKIAEMRTGEGKTLAATAPAYLNALSGLGVHIITVNDYLARRDTVWMGQIYHFLGLTVGCINHDESFLYDPSYRVQESTRQENGNPKTQISSSQQTKKPQPKDVPPLVDNSQNANLDELRDTQGSFRVVQEFLRPVSRKEAYAADITYGTNNEFGFDYLRDNMVLRLEDMVQRPALSGVEGGHHFAIVDEVDSILIDEARTPLIISAPDAESTSLYDQFSRIVPRLSRDADYIVDEKLRAVTLTDEGVVKVEKILGMPELFTDQGIRHVHHLEQALKAHVLFVRDKDYVVRDGEVIIVDEFTGRLMPGRRFSEGLHQALEAKEGVRVQQESRTLATVTFQNYFRMYKKLAGMTGTAVTNAEEFHKVYKLEVVVVPTNKPMIRKDHPDLIFKSEQGKWNAVVGEIKRRSARGQPVLVGTISIEKNERLSVLLRREGISHNVLNAKQHEREGEIIAQAGRFGGVTVATNMAGRGVDIILGGNPPDPAEAEKVRELGGLVVIGTERHEARRIDNQLRGRTGRQGDPGETQFFVSLEDDLMRIFGGDKIKGLMERLGLPEDQPISHGMVSRALESAQERIEGFNFDMRKHVLEYDDVMNKHRETIYGKRRALLRGETDAAEEFKKAAEQEIAGLVDSFFLSRSDSQWDAEEFTKICATLHPLPQDFQGSLRTISEDASRSAEEQQEALSELVHATFLRILEEKEKQFGEEPFRQLTKFILLRTTDALWMDHLETMEQLRDAVRLRAYGQRDPLVEYKNEAHRLFKNLLAAIRSQSVRTVFRVQSVAVQPFDKTQGKQAQGGFSGPQQTGRSVDRQTGRLGGGVGNQSANLPGNKPAAIGRNDPCPCGSGKKYKKCHGQ